MKLLDKLEEYICSIALLLSAIVLFVNIVLRYFFSAGLPWAEELVRYLIVVVTFVGLSIGVRDKATISMDILLQITKKGTRRKIEIAINLISSIFSLCLAVISFQFAIQTKSFGQITSAMQLPFYILYLILSFGSIICAMRYFEVFISKIKEPKLEDLAKEVKK